VVNRVGRLKVVPVLWGLIDSPAFGLWHFPEGSSKGGLLCIKNTFVSGTGTYATIPDCPVVIKEILLCG
jgi:hypothetical protein